MKHWKIAGLALFGLFASWGTAQADGKSNCAKPTVTVYEISGNGVSGMAEAVQTLKTAIEKREAFAESDCELKHLDRHSDAQVAYECQRSDSKTDQMFREATSTQPSLKLLTRAVRPTGPQCDVNNCPFKCTLSTDTCGGGDRCCSVISAGAPCKTCTP